MKIVLNSIDNEYLETIFFENLNNINDTFQKFTFIKKPLEAKIYAINESISSHKLSIFKNNFEKINIRSLCIYSNNRDTILAGKSLKINSIFIKEQDAKNNLILINSKNKDDILHEGTVRSGERISSSSFESSRSNFFFTSFSLIKVEFIFKDFPANIVSLLLE